MKKIKVKRNKSGLTLDLTQYNILSEALEELSSLLEEQKEFWINANIELLIDTTEIDNTQIEKLIEIINLYQININKIIISNNSQQKLFQQYNFPTEVLASNKLINSENLIPSNSVEDQTVYISSQNNSAVALRSGQKVQYDGTVIITGDVNDGCKIIATGSIIVFGKLAGDVHAGYGIQDDELLQHIQVKALKVQDPIHVNIGHYSASSAQSKDKKLFKQKVYPETFVVKDNQIYRMADFN